MAVEKLSQFPLAGSPPGPTDTLAGAQAGANIKYSFSQLTTAPFAATGRILTESLADRAGNTFIDVKADYGAKGDGVTDDTTAIQAALNAAFGVAGSIASTAQRRVIFPPGKYIVTGSGLTGTNWFGGVIQGSGRFTTIIQNSGGGPVITTNGCEYMRFEDMNLDGAGGTNPIFDLDWTNTGTALQSNTFFNMYFSSGGVGLRIAHSNFMGSENLILNCFFANCTTAGIQVGGTNALQQTMVGGNIQNCGIGIELVQGSFNVIDGVGFQQSATFDIQTENNSQNTMSVIGCRTESPNFINNTISQNMQISACHQTSASGRGLFYVGNGGMAHISACLFDGQVQPKSWARICIQACQPYNEVVAGDWLIKNVSDWWYIPSNPFALSIEIENVESFLVTSGNLGLVIDKQRIFTPDGVNIVTLNYLNAQTTFAALPAPKTATGGHALITDCNSGVWGSRAGGGGTIFADVFSDGRAWYVEGVGSLSRVVFDAAGTKLYVAPPATSASYTGITVGSGANRALVVSLNFGYNTGVPPSAVSVHWDSAGTNQAMTQIVSGSNIATNDEVQLWGLVAPTSGNKTLSVSWTGNAEVFVTAVSFINVNQTGGATTFPNSSATLVNTPNPKVTITSDVGHAVVGTLATQNAQGTYLADTTTIYKDNASGAFINAGAVYEVSGLASVDIGWTGGGNTVLIAGTDVVNG
jgi:hypothetical protein